MRLDDRDGIFDLFAGLFVSVVMILGIVWLARFTWNSTVELVRLIARYIEG